MSGSCGLLLFFSVTLMVQRCSPAAAETVKDQSLGLGHCRCNTASYLARPAPSLSCPVPRLDHQARQSATALADSTAAARSSKKEAADAAAAVAVARREAVASEKTMTQLKAELEAAKATREEVSESRADCIPKMSLYMSTCPPCHGSDAVMCEWLCKDRSGIHRQGQALPCCGSEQRLEPGSKFWRAVGVGDSGA